MPGPRGRAFVFVGCRVSLRDITDEIYAEFVGHGLAETATYQPAGGGSPFPVACTIDFDLEQYDTGSDVRGLADAVIIAIPRSQLPGITRGDTITAADGRTYTVERRVRADDGRWSLLCRP